MAAPFLPISLSTCSPQPGVSTSSPSSISPSSSRASPMVTTRMTAPLPGQGQFSLFKTSRGTVHFEDLYRMFRAYRTNLDLMNAIDDFNERYKASLRPLRVPPSRLSVHHFIGLGLRRASLPPPPCYDYLPLLLRCVRSRRRIRGPHRDQAEQSRLCSSVLWRTLDYN